MVLFVPMQSYFFLNFFYITTHQKNVVVSMNVFIMIFIHYFLPFFGLIVKLFVYLFYFVFIFIAGSDASTAVIEGSIIFLTELFRNCRIIGNKEKLKLRGQFGEYPQSAANKAFDIVKKLVECLQSDVQEDFIQNGFPKHDGLMAEEFGSKIKFVDPSPPDESFYLVPVKDYAIEIKEDAFKKLSFKFEPPPPKEDKLEPVAQKPVFTPRRFDQQWLEKELAKSMGSSSEQFSPAEFAVTVIQLLKSKSNEEVQSEVSFFFIS